MEKHLFMKQETRPYFSDFPLGCCDHNTSRHNMLWSKLHTICCDHNTSQHNMLWSKFTHHMLWSQQPNGKRCWVWQVIFDSHKSQICLVTGSRPLVTRNSLGAYTFELFLVTSSFAGVTLSCFRPCYLSTRDGDRKREDHWSAGEKG